MSLLWGVHLVPGAALGPGLSLLARRLSLSHLLFWTLLLNPST
ncbi:hypothetical protein [Thermus thermophilus]|nr:hypothetical protein [Thermus thermophilus]